MGGGTEREQADAAARELTSAPCERRALSHNAGRNDLLNEAAPSRDKLPYMPAIKEFLTRGEVVILAGAGVSVGPPSALPGWKALNRSIVNALCSSVEKGLQRPDWLGELRRFVDAQREADRFPPEYQAQLIEEMCGERYFHALQALDIDVINPAHDAIAALAAAGALKAIVTTNFDRLIERALDLRGVPYMTAFDDDGYQRIPAKGVLAVIKIHGCVSAPLSMIDTLKQRRRGRAAYLENCLAPLHSGYWIYAGFSAADLEGNHDYLGLVKGAGQSAGATYVAFPGNPTLGDGAQLLIGAHGDRGTVVVADIAEHLNSLSGNQGSFDAGEPLGPARVDSGLHDWAESLSVSAAALCLGAVLEAIGQAEPAVRILDRLVRKEEEERGTSDYRAVQLHYGRLGAAWGRFVRVPDLNGVISNASVESMQSLMRIMDSELAYPARTWLICALLWHNRGGDAMEVVAELVKMKAPADEAEVDACIATAQLLLLNTSDAMVQMVIDTVPSMLAMAARSGDAVRVARVAALGMLALAETRNDLPARVGDFQSEFAEAARVGDRFAMGMRELALGRWHVGAGGLALAATAGSDAIAQRAIAHLAEAMAAFEQQGMDPWYLFAMLQQAKAFADLRRFDDVVVTMNAALPMIDRFPILTSHFREVEGQLKTMVRDEEAQSAFLGAIDAAKQSGLLQRAEMLQKYVR